VAGWVFEMLWQAFFQLQSKTGMWICLALILGALVSFGRALLRLYGCGLTLSLLVPEAPVAFARCRSTEKHLPSAVWM
jgi:hypothetical protein